jgi:hypothetical protein
MGDNILDHLPSMVTGTPEDSIRAAFEWMNEHVSSFRVIEIIFDIIHIWFYANHFISTILFYPIANL